MTVDPQENLLTQVFGQVRVSQEREQLAVDAAAIPPVQFFERGRFLPADSEHEFGVAVTVCRDVVSVWTAAMGKRNCRHGRDGRYSRAEFLTKRKIIPRRGSGSPDSLNQAGGGRLSNRPPP
jgi:hypothetical protein